MKQIGPFVTAVAHYAENQERKAHAEFWWHMDARQRLQFSALGPEDRPWRGLLQPTLVHLINMLEDEDHYDVSDLTGGHAPIAEEVKK